MEMNPFGGGANGNPTAPGTGGAEGGSIEQKPQYLTKTEAEALVKQASEDAWRRAQSHFDKVGSKVQVELRDRLAAMETTFAGLARAGSAVPDEIKDRAKQQAINEILAGGGSDAASNQAAVQAAPGNQPAAGQPDEDVFTQRYLAEMHETFGFAIDQGDPEAELIDASTPKLFRASVLKAMQAKAKRASVAPSAAYSPTARAPALGAGGTRSNPLDGVTNPDRLWEMVRESHKFA